MAAPKWFDYATYKINKLAQLQQLDSSWNQTKMEEAFNKAGFTGTDGYYQHFQKYGHTEDVSPNEFFDAQYYYKAKALQFYTSEAGGSIAEETVLAQLETYADRVKGLINDAGMDAWTHYIKYGTAEGINPSNSFDTSAYMEAKLTAMKTQDPNYTMEDLTAAFKKANLNALEHAMQYAGNGNTYEAADAVAIGKDVPAAYAVPEDEQISENTTTEFMFTTNVDRLVGTTADDTFTGTTGTVVAADSVDGKTGTDTVEIWARTEGEAIANFNLPKLTNVENLVFHNVQMANNAARDFSTVGVTSVGFGNLIAANGAVTATLTGADSQSLALSGLASAGNAQTVKLKGFTGVTVDGVAGGNGNWIVDVAGKQTEFTVTANGDDSAFTLGNTGGKLKTLNAGEGKGNVAVVADAAPAAALTTVDASAATGNFSLDISAAANTDNMASFKFTGGSGDDEILLSTAQLAKIKGANFDGGDGTDTIGVSNGATTALGATAVKQLGAVTGFESFKVTETSASAFTISDAAALKNFDEVTFKAGAAGASFAVAAGAEGISTWNLDLSDFTASAVSLTAGKNNTSITMNVDAGTASADLTALNLTGIKTVNMNVSGDDLKIGTLAATGTDLTLNLSGSEKVAIASASMGQAFTLNGASLTDSLSFKGSLAKGSTLTGGSEADTFDVTSTLAAGQGNITIDLEGGSGKDTFKLDAGTSNNGLTTFEIGDYEKGVDAIQVKAAAAAKADKIAEVKDITQLSQVALATGWNGWVMNGETYVAYASAAVSAGKLFDNAATVIKLAGVSSLDDVTAGDFSTVA